MADFWLGILNLKNIKHVKKELNEKLIPVAWHPKGCQDWCMPENRKKEIETMLLKKSVRLFWSIRKFLIQKPRMKIHKDFKIIPIVCAQVLDKMF